jgi:hypothetical protein
VEKDRHLEDVFRAMADELSQNVFNGSRVEIHVCDEYLKTRKVVQQSTKH